MTGNQPANLSPSACFVVERVRSEGYQVTSARGRYADEWKGRAVDLLEALGQPDPRGPAKDFRLVGPITPSGEYVGVYVKLMPNGEARYRQAWFQVPKPVPRARRSILVVVVLVIVAFAAGAFAGRNLLAPDPPTARGPVAGEAGSPDSNKPDPSEKDAKLKSELASSRDVRAKLKKYLSQEGFAADISTSVIEEKRSVKLIADLDRTPPPKETILLSNIEVARLVSLLETLDEWTANPKAAPKPEGR